MEKHTNDLIHESSPYLLQHAHNPVNWIPWSNDVYSKAKNENKLVLISIGYSACHWCHVMEHECFEDEEVAALMNKFFINVKVDREERPDVDQVYMTAVQLLTNKGGWPLNCFTLPDGRPIYGGTYFPKESWMHVLKSLYHTYEHDIEKVLEYAEGLLRGIQAHELVSPIVGEVVLQQEKLDELIARWSKGFDSIHGGESRAPKFPLPTSYDFLLEYAISTKNQKLEKHVELSLDKMAMGAIYDQIGGGFSRYSVDMLWKIPHFEKMLYDNGQLIGLYAKAYAHYKKPNYQRVIEESTNWLEREMMNDANGFYSAIDADSEGIEGKFYVWTKEELIKILGVDFDWFAEFYNINQYGFWEEENYVLIRSQEREAFANKMNWSVSELDAKVSKANETLLKVRKERIHPGIDDKIITSWNAMTVSGLCQAYLKTGEDRYRLLARKNMQFLIGHQLKEDVSLWRIHKNGHSKIDGFLEDYAHMIDALIQLYFCTNEQNWLDLAIQLVERTLVDFSDNESGMFFFTDKQTELIARKMEMHDNVIPSSNSVMAKNLFLLGKLYHRGDFMRRSEQMLKNVYEGMEMYGSGYSNWALLLNFFVNGFREIVCVGAEAQENAAQLNRLSISSCLIVWSKGENELPIFEHRIGGENLIFVCEHGICHSPMKSVTEVMNFVIQ